MSKRLEQLDSMRGLAALSVLIGHYLQTIPAFWPVESVNSWIWFILKRTPVSIIQAGHSAVILFFVLSGFVLALPFAGGRSIPYRVFFVKRVARIWLPYIAILFLGWLVHRTLGGSSAGLSEWFAAYTMGKPDLSDTLGSVNLIGNFNTAKILLVVWSLVVEMRISLIFPFLYLLVSKMSSKTVVILSFCLLTASWLLGKVENTTSYSETLMYVPMFCVGILLANNRDELTDWWIRLSFAKRSLLLSIAVMMYTWSYWAASLPHVFHLTPFVFSLITLACVIFIVCAVAGNRMSSVLKGRWLLVPGISSYSLYLIHPLVLLSVLRFTSGFPPALTLMMVIISSVITAYISYVLIERPSIALGAFLAKKVYPVKEAKVIEVQKQTV